MKKAFFISIFLIVACVLGYLSFKDNGERYRSVEVNGKTMKAHISGSGDKTIVMLSGWGVDSPIDEFYPVYAELSKDYKVVVLEYFGYFGSDDTDEERTNEKMVEEIRAALHGLDIEPPYILMPHSMSGLYSLYYVRKYPSEVSAIIGLDMSLPQKQLERWNTETFEKTKSENATRKLNTSVMNQWNEFYNNSKELENIKYPYDLPVLAFLASEQINNVDDMIKSGEMKTSWLDINKNMITDPNIQSVEFLQGSHDNLMYDQTDKILEFSKKFMANL